MSIRYRATSSGPDSQRQNHARRDRGLPPLAPGESRLLTQLVESAGSAGTAIVTGLALVAALASPITATGRADVSISSFLASTGTLGQVVGRGKAVDTVDSNSV